MSDQWRADKLPAGMGYRGDVVRDPPVFDEYPVGPWRARVRITPLLGIARAMALTPGAGADDGAVFEVSAAWEHGPPLVAFAEHWDGRPQAAVDQVQVGDRELARAVALEAVDLLRAGTRFDLQTLARERAARR